MSTNVITLYDINRVRPPKAPARDDAQDPHFVPAPCQVACPVGTDAPSYIGYIWEEKYEEAFEAITATNPFSSICGRVCDAPCEPACRRADSDGPIAIRNLKRYVMDKLGDDHHLPPVHVTRKETVGIVGAGPAGLTAAQDLAEAGFEVHVYEMMDKPGGMMVWGIPGFRLPPGIIAEDMKRHRLSGADDRAVPLSRRFFAGAGILMGRPVFLEGLTWALPDDPASLSPFRTLTGRPIAQARNLRQYSACFNPS